MKKILLSLMLMLACQLVSAQTAKTVFNDYKNEKKATYVSVPRMLVKLASGKIDDNRVSALLDNVKTVKVLTLDECSGRVKRGFAKRITALASKGYDEMARVKDGTDNVLTLVKQSDDHIEEVVVLVSDDDSCIGVYIAGKINREDIDALVDMVGH